MKNHCFIFIWVLLFIASCGSGPDRYPKNDTSINSDTIPASGTQKVTTAFTEKSYKGKGVTYRVREDKSLGASVSRITVIASDSTHTDSLNLGDKDPVQTGMLADLDENNQDELYLVTRSVGSGSFAHIAGFMRDDQNKLVAIEVPEITQEDQARGKQFEGYMGHDTVFIRKNMMIRKYPKYNTGDTNDKPTGGTKEIRYSLVGSKLEVEK
jgi:hypothetical protein